MKESNIKTSWTFPIIEYSSQVYYFEVKKASGIAFILLELISNVEHHSEKIVSMLYNFGVPYDIHYIFGDELFNMFVNGIIRLKDNREYFSELLSEYVISDFEITDLGRKLFSEGTIPTGREEIKKTTIYFDVVAKEQMHTFKDKLFSIENTALDSKCFGEVYLDGNDIELFITENMKNYGFRKNESISKFKHEEPTRCAYKSENAVNISFDEYKMYLSFNNKVVSEYLKKYYSSSVISGIIMNKSKFNFPKKFAEYINRLEYDEIDNKFAVFMPSQIQNVLDTKCELSLSVDSIMKNSSCIIDNTFARMAFEKLGLVNCYACYFTDGNLFKVLIGEYSIDLDGWGEKCNIQLIVTAVASSDEKSNLIDFIYNEYIPDCNIDDKCNVIKAIYNITNNQRLLENFISSSIAIYKMTEDKVNGLLTIHNSLKSINICNRIIIDKATSLLNDLCSEISLDNIALKHSYGKKLKDMINMYDADYLSLIGNSLKERNNDIIVYEALCNLGYDADDVLNISNALKIWINNILNNEPIYNSTKLGALCSRLQRSFNELKAVSGIENPMEDDSNLDINNDGFVVSYNSYQEILCNISKYKEYANQEFYMLNLFTDRFTELCDIITLEREANSDPRKINRKYIKSLLNKSKYKYAICDLYVRLEYELNSLLEIPNDGVFELLESKEIKGYLNNDEIAKLQNLRLCRNGFSHPKKRRNIDYSANIIMEWYDIIEKMEVTINEPRS